MTWVRLDDNFHWHPKVACLSDGAYRLFVGTLCYCNRFSRGDCVTTREILGNFGRKSLRLAEELVAAGLWDAAGDGWAIHDYFVYQPDPKKQAAGRARAQQMLSTRSADAQPRPVPSRPEPVGSKEPPVIPLTKDRLYGVPETHMHVNGLTTLSETLKNLVMQPEPRKETA